MTRIYTRKGDRGTTSILGGGRLSKSDPRIRALGGLDEVNAALGLILSQPSFPAQMRPALQRVQDMLLEAGAALAVLEPETSAELFVQETRWLEEEIDRAEQRLEPLTQFLLPGGGEGGAGLHWVRTVHRRAEGLVVAAVGEEVGREGLLMWVNRLSDAFFVWARLANAIEGAGEVRWTSRSRPQAGPKDMDPPPRTEPPKRSELPERREG
jgi:cob(I)alamin adenosyltransferase